MTRKTDKPQAVWKRMMALAVSLFLTGAAQASPTVVNGAFSDNFSSYAQTACMTDGATFGVWSVPFSGYGCVSLPGSYVQLSPEASTTPSATHAALAVGPSFTNPMTFSVDVKTVAQLRTGSTPNPWEIGWVYWDYTDNTHFYYFQAKPNGWELGKEDPAYAGAQRFLATGSSPVFPVGGTYLVKVVQTGTNTMAVYVNGSLVTSYTDTQTPYTSGKIGLYCEDSSVQFSNVAVNAAGSTAGGGGGTTAPAGAPTVTSLSPATLQAGSAGLNLTVNGSGFQSGSVVYWNGAALKTFYQSSTSLLGWIATTNLASAGTESVTVQTPGANASSPVTFTITGAAASAPAPTITSLSPATLPAGSAGLNLTVNGSGFQSSSVVYWNGSALKTFYQSSTSLLGWIATTNLTSAGTANVTVQTPGAAVSSPAAFTITGAAVGAAGAAISSLSPATLPAGSAGLNLTVNGSGFQSGSVVYWNGAALKTFYQSSTSLLGWIATTNLASAGTESVTVQTPGANASSPVTFTITGAAASAPAPTITSLSPATLPAGSAGLNLTVNGSGFQSGSVVYWNGSPLKTFYQGPTVLLGWITTTNLMSAGTANVTVETPGAATSGATTFTIASVAIKAAAVIATPTATQTPTAAPTPTAATPTAKTTPTAATPTAATPTAKITPAASTTSGAGKRHG